MPWRATGSASDAGLVPGDTWRASGTVRIYLPENALRQEPEAAHFNVTLERFFAGDGSPRWRSNNFMSVLITPTGFPIERSGGVVPVGLGGEITGLRRIDALTVEGTFSAAILLPIDLPGGLYRPALSVSFPGLALARPPVDSRLDVFSLIKAEFGSGYLPPLAIGDTQPPHLVWTLLTDTLSQGTRGTVASEDRDRFGISSKIVHQAEKLIVPMIEPGTGERIAYRLEPFVPMVANADRGLANSPTIAFRFPSGSLRVLVRKPDGAVDDLGRAPFVQSRSASPMTSAAVAPDDGGGNLGDVYQLTTLNEGFEYVFSQYGRHEIVMDGTVEDVYGNVYHGGGTYEVFVARTLDIKPGLIPTTPFEVGDSFAPSVTVYPGVPADVEVRLRLHVNSSAIDVVERVLAGSANRFGYFHPGIRVPPAVLTAPGEYRVDITARFAEPDGTLWMGSLSWGQVVETPDTPLVAHGRRGIDSTSEIGPAWFMRGETGDPVGSSHVNFPYYNGDILWQTLDDAAQVRASVEDTGGEIAELLRQRAHDSTPCVEGPPEPGPDADNFGARAAAGELPLFSATVSGWAPSYDDRMALWVGQEDPDEWGGSRVYPPFRHVTEF